MNLLELKRRLTSHLVSEDDTTLHTEEDRIAALQDAYSLINERYHLTIGVTATLPQMDDLLGDDTLPADFVSWTHVRGKYVAKPPALEDDTDEPWSGKFEAYHVLIPVKAAQLIWQNKGEGYADAAKYWNEQFENNCERIRISTIRRYRAAVEALNAGPNTYGELLYKLSSGLQRDLPSEEEIMTQYPMELRKSIIQDAYKQITTEEELWVGITTGTIDRTTNAFLSIPLPSDYIGSTTDTLLVSGKGKLGKTDIPALYHYDPQFADSIYRRTGTVMYYAINTTQPEYSSETPYDQTKPMIVLYPYDSTARDYRLMYVASPPAMVELDDQPWSGKYANFSNLIYLRAMKELYRSNPAMMNVSRYYANEYDRELIEFKKFLRRERRSTTVLKVGQQSTQYFTRGDRSAD